MILNIAAFIVVLGVLVAVHELGHMLAAKACRVGVPEFAIGFGPRLFGFRIGETVYNLRAIPLGGFCAIAGMADDATDAPGSDRSDADYPPERQWGSKNGWQKAFILVSGPLMNFLMVMVIMIIMGFIGFSQAIIFFASVEPDSPAEQAGIVAGDILLELDGRTIDNVYQFMGLVQDSGGREIPVVVQRGNERRTLMATPKTMEGFNDNKVSLGVGLDIGILSSTQISLIQPKTVGYEIKLRNNDIVTHVNGQKINHGWELMTYLAGQNTDGQLVNRSGDPIEPETVPPIKLTVQRQTETLHLDLPGDTTYMTLGVVFHPELEKLPVGQTIMRGLEDTFYMLLSLFSFLKVIFSAEGARSLAGPVGIFSMVGQSAHSGWYTFLQMTMMISFSLGFFNLLPLPLVDGGRLVFVALKGIGIRIAEQREAMVHQIGAFLLIGLFLLLTFFDVIALFNYNRP